jgi:hypothetical protein
VSCPPSVSLGALGDTRDNILSFLDTARAEGIELSFLTLNAQKAGANSPSLADTIGLLLHNHTPDFFF